MIVREAQASDDERVGELLVEAFVEAYAEKMPEVVVTESRKQLLRDVATKRSQASVFVLEYEGLVAGTVALFGPSSSESEAWLPNCADLRHLAIDRRLHGKGLSKPLLDEAERTARLWDVDAICLHVRRGAFGVARLYQSRGYQRDPSGDIERPEIYLEAYKLPCR